MDGRTVIWITPDSGAGLPPLALRLRAFGFDVQPRVAGTLTPATALRVLPCDAFGSMEELQREYLRELAPTLVLLEPGSLAVEPCEFLRTLDEIGISGEPAELVARRLNFLEARSGRGGQDGRLREAQAALERDPLTGLLNRRAFESRARKMLEAPLAEQMTAILLLDLDHFKRVNDTFGHAAGDAVLREVAAVLRSRIRATDLCARYGGEEFLVLLTGQDEQGLIGAAQALLEMIAARDIMIDGRPIRVTVSAGLVFPHFGADFQDILKQIDLALYEAKDAGRNRLIVFERLQEDATRQDEDLYLRNFENVVRVVNERVTNQITLMARRLMKQAWRQANQDYVTELWSRRYFDTKFAREIELARRRRGRLAIAMADLDDFRAINKRFGYSSADRALQKFSQVTRGHVQAPNWTARWGGEEFIVVMVDTNLQVACDLAERIRREVESSAVESLRGEAIRFTVSIGVAAFTPGMRSVTDLVDKAARALRRAKDNGKNRVEVERDDGEDDDDNAAGELVLA